MKAVRYFVRAISLLTALVIAVMVVHFFAVLNPGIAACSAHLVFKLIWTTRISLLVFGALVAIGGTI